MVDLVRDRIDTQKTKDGVWVPIKDFGEVKLRKWNNEEFRKLAVKFRNERAAELGLGEEDDLDIVEAQKVMYRAACYEVVVDWRGITSDGEEVPYTPELGEQVFCDPEEAWADQIGEIVRISTERAKFLQERTDANVKKS